MIDTLSDKVMRCEACGEKHSMSTTDGQHIRIFGMCQDCYKYFDGLYRYEEIVRGVLNSQRGADK